MLTRMNDKSERCDVADLEENLLTLRKQSYLAKKADLKKSKGKADLKKLAKNRFVFGADRKKS